MNFWQQLPRPFFVLAPMDDVTDVVFRQIVAAVAAPDVFFTEFVSTDGLQSAGRGSAMERLRLESSPTRPIVAQIWGNNPEAYYRSAKDIADLGFAGIDINLGCPAHDVVARGCGGGLIGQNDQVAELVAAVREGAPDLPLSLKTRLGRNHIITEEWTGFLLGLDITALTIHGRTVKEMSKVPAHWDEIAKVPSLRDQIAPRTLIIGNGDIADRAHGLQLAAQTGVDGLMIGRGIFHNIYAFADAAAAHPPAERLTILRRHLDLYEQRGSTKPYQTLKKFFKIYVSGWNGAAELRAKLMDTREPNEARTVLTNAQLPM
jgi:tRNA-dihydrouridine synthase